VETTPAGSCQRADGRENAIIHYSGEPCAKGNEWNVPRDTVLDISVYSEEKPLFSELHVDMSRLKKREDPELQGYATYTNDDEGMSYEVSVKGVLQGVYYFGVAKDQALRCSAQRSKPRT